MTPRKFKAQLDVHQDIQQQMNGGPPSRVASPTKTGYIDQIPNW